MSGFLSNIYSVSAFVLGTSLFCSVNGEQPLYISNVGSTVVNILNSSTQQVSGTVTGIANGFSITTSGTGVYVAQRDPKQVSIIDTALSQVVGVVPLPAGDSPAAIAINGNKVYVGIYTDDIQVIDTLTQSIITTIPLSGVISLAASGPFMYAIPISTNLLYTIDTINDQIVGTGLTVGINPQGIAAAGTALYIADNGSNTVLVVDTVLNQVINSVSVGNFPLGIALGGTGIYVVNNGDQTVNVIDINTQQIAGTIGTLTDFPLNLALAGTGMYIPLTGGLQIIDINTNQLAGFINMGLIQSSDPLIGNPLIPQPPAPPPPSQSNYCNLTLISSVPGDASYRIEGSDQPLFLTSVKSIPNLSSQQSLIIQLDHCIYTLTLGDTPTATTNTTGCALSWQFIQAPVSGGKDVTAYVD